MNDSTNFLRMRIARLVLALAVVSVFLAACDEEDVILPGKRESIRPEAEAEAADALRENESRPIRLPALQANTSWPQPFGTPEFRTENPRLSNALSLAWSTNIGAGDTRRQRIIASPVVGGGLIYTLDAEALVTATSANGQIIWQRDLRPARDKSGQGTGGGLAYDDGRLYVALGYGAVVSLDAVSGSEQWRQQLGGTASGAPTVFAGLVYVTVGDDKGWALETDTGRLRWQLLASPDVSNVLGAPSPAVGNGLAIFAFGSGEVQAVFRQGGLRRWDASVSGERLGTALGSIGDITASPVIAGNRVYVGNQAGRVVALELETGVRIWTAAEGAEGRIVPVGGSVFMITDLNQLLRLDASDGSRIWAVPLPRFVKDRPTRRAEIFRHYGPILAGGRIYVASADEKLRSFDPVSGALLETVEIPGGASSEPVVAGGVLYVVSSKGQLHAFR